jgi:uncharacterized phage-associated protein
MFRPFDRAKAVQASAVIAVAEGKRLSKLRLLKLLYIADRRSLRETGRPILGSKAVAMPHGPLHSDVLNLIDGKLPNPREWDRHFKRVGKRDVELFRPADNSTLSKYDIELLQDVVRLHEEINDYDLSKLTHDFQEWDKFYKKGTSTVIPLEEIIDAVGRTDDKQAILADLQDDMAFDSFFAKCTST